MIHPTAVIDPSASIGTGVSIGAYSIIGAEVEIGDGTEIGPHVVITGPTRIGRDNRIFQFASIGAEPQDIKFAGERTELIIGDRNLFRENVTVNRGTGFGGGITRIGNDNWFLAYVHIAHDCQVGNHTIFSSYSGLAGHVRVDDWAIFSSYAGAHQFSRIGTHAFIGMSCLAHADVAPYMILSKDTEQHGRIRSINLTGLKRHGFSSERIALLKRAYRILFRSGLSLEEARVQLDALDAESQDIRELLDFIAGSERSLVR